MHKTLPVLAVWMLFVWIPLTLPTLSEAQSLGTREGVPAGSAAKRDKLIGKARLESRRQNGKGLTPQIQRQPCAGEVGATRPPSGLSQARSRIEANRQREQNTVITGDVVIDCR